MKNKNSFIENLEQKIKFYKNEIIFKMFHQTIAARDNLKRFVKNNEAEIIEYCYENLYKSVYHHELDNNLRTKDISIYDSIFITRNSIIFEKSTLPAMKLMLNLIIIIFCDKIMYLTNSDRFNKTTFKTLELNTEILFDDNLFEDSWHRGQSDADWFLLPSYYRNINIPRGKILEINHDYLINDYKEKKLLEKYENIFQKDEVNYNFLSYMQHAIGYSPLLDFSESQIIATVFALANVSDFNRYNNKDSALFSLKITNLKEDYIDSFDENITKAKIYICDKYTIGDKVGDNEIRTFDDLINILTPEFMLVKTKTNDRMRYQKGTFIYFYNFLIISDTIFYNLNKDLVLTRYIISKDKKKRTNKENIFDKIVDRFPYYKERYLLEPYEWFKQ